jgi:hypothetical protein
MQRLTLEQVADYLETATIEATEELGPAIIHTGKRDGLYFVLVNTSEGASVLIEYERKLTAEEQSAALDQWLGITQ